MYGPWGPLTSTRKDPCLLRRAETDVMDESLPEEILLDENAEAAKHPFYMIGGTLILSPSQRYR